MPLPCFLSPRPASYVQRGQTLLVSLLCTRTRTRAAPPRSRRLRKPRRRRKTADRCGSKRARLVKSGLKRASFPACIRVGLTTADLEIAYLTCGQLTTQMSSSNVCSTYVSNLLKYTKRGYICRYILLRELQNDEGDEISGTISVQPDHKNSYSNSYTYICSLNYIPRDQLIVKQASFETSNDAREMASVRKESHFLKIKRRNNKIL